MQVKVLNQLKLDLQASTQSELRTLEHKLANGSHAASEVAQLEDQIRRTAGFLPAPAKKAWDKAQRSKKLSERSEKERVFDVYAFTQQLRTQRKIRHLLRTDVRDGNFCYCPELAKDHGLAEGQWVWLTEKWDGTTAQVMMVMMVVRMRMMRVG
jgi:hypothetical protein